MCILIVKPQGVLSPSKETLKTCFTRNPDGAGISYNKNGKIIIKKGFMDFESFRKAVDKIPVESSALIHCRITTSGGTKKELTHPYPLDNDYKNMMKTSNVLEPVYGKSYAVAHNGIFSGFGHHELVNDTCEFIANLLKPIQDITNDILQDKLDPVINRLVDTSRLAILDNCGNWKKYGNGWIEVDGIWYSNSSYKEYKTTYQTSAYGGSWNNGTWTSGSYAQYKCSDKQKTQSYGEWMADIIEEYGSYQEYLDFCEMEKIEKLKEEYPDYEEDIEAYAEYGYSAWQIRHWIEEDYLSDSLSKSNKKK